LSKTRLFFLLLLFALPLAARLLGDTVWRRIY
jgi:hypothetical protein